MTRVVYGRAFEALFVVGLKGLMTTSLTRRLQQELGVRLDALEHSYPHVTWERAIGLAAEELYGDLRREHAYALLGELLTAGYFVTPMGVVASATLRLLGPARAMQRLDHVISTANNYFESRAIRHADNHFSLLMNEPGLLRDMVRGSLQYGF
ncbi:MAG: DUF2378 family protein, partial [Archangium sp.]